MLFRSSGGALALGVANRILMLENAVYSVLSPEGFASILWKDSSRSGEACEIMKLTAQDLYRDGIVEQVIPEPVGGAQRGHAALFESLDAALRQHLKELCRLSGKQLADQRYQKFWYRGTKKFRWLCMNLVRAVRSISVDCHIALDRKSTRLNSSHRN